MERVMEYTEVEREDGLDIPQWQELDTLITDHRADRGKPLVVPLQFSDVCVHCRNRSRLCLAVTRSCRVS